jgi:hypothetical protein
MMASGRVAVLLALLASAVVADASRAACTSETRKFCGGFSGKSGTETFSVPAGQALSSPPPSVQVSATGFRSSSASAPAAVGPGGFRVDWQAGALGCVEFTVKYCYLPR